MILFIINEILVLIHSWNIKSEFNELSSEEQGEIYKQVKPLAVMVEETISDLSGAINYYLNSYYAMYMIDEIDDMRDQRDGLRACEME